MVGPDYNDRIILLTAGLERIEHAANLCIHKADAGKVGPDFALEKTMCLDAFQAWLREGPVDIPGEAGGVLAIISSNRW